MRRAATEMGLGDEDDADGVADVTFQHSGQLTGEHVGSVPAPQGFLRLHGIFKHQPYDPP